MRIESPSFRSLLGQQMARPGQKLCSLLIEVVAGHTAVGKLESLHDKGGVGNDRSGLISLKRARVRDTELFGSLGKRQFPR